MARLLNKPVIFTASRGVAIPRKTLMKESFSKQPLKPQNKQNKKLCRAVSRQVNGLTLNIPFLNGLLGVNRKAKKDVYS